MSELYAKIMSLLVLTNIHIYLNTYCEHIVPMYLHFLFINVKEKN